VRKAGNETVRLRKTNLKTGILIVFFHPEERSRNRSLLVLVEGAKDIEPLGRIELACELWKKDHPASKCEMFTVPDAGRLCAQEPHLDPSRILSLEAAEFSDLRPEELNRLLSPALDRLSLDEVRIFPAVGGAVGAVAEGIHFIDRERDMESATSLLAEGKNLLVVAPRRSGKTSFLKKIGERLSDTFFPIFLDAERYSTEEDLAAMFWRLASGECVRVSLEKARQTGWKTLVQESLEKITREKNKSILLFMDELVYFLRNLLARFSAEEQKRRKASEFIRGLSEALRAENLTVRLIVAGSLELLQYLEEIGLNRDEIDGIFRDITIFHLPPLAEETLSLELRRLLLGTGIVPEEDDLRWICDNLDLSVPYPALRFLDGLSAQLRAWGRIDTAKLEAALSQFLDTTDAFNDFDEHISRKSAEIPNLNDAVSKALNALALGAWGSEVPEADILSRLHNLPGARSEDLFRWLIETFPLCRFDGRVRFASRLWRRWWRRREGID